MKQPDHIDRQILQILSKEARIPLKTLAGLIGLSRSATGERVHNLEKSGIIRGYRADIGHLNSPNISAFLFITLNKTPAPQLLDQLAGYAEVRRVSSLSGQLDMIVELEVPSIDRLNDLRDLIATNDQVADLTTSIILRHDINRHQT